MNLKDSYIFEKARTSKRF